MQERPYAAHKNLKYLLSGPSQKTFADLNSITSGKY